MRGLRSWKRCECKMNEQEINNYLQIMSETYYKFLTSIDWNDQNLLNGLKEGKGKFLSNLWLSLFNKNKYSCAQYISFKALDKLNRNFKKELVFEHVVPKRLYIQEECENKAKNNELTETFICDLLSKYWIICTITREENDLLNKSGLKDKMPFNWDKENVFARYDTISLKYQLNPLFKIR
ncbi:hypothetical protein HYU21_04235 [Candidatus Woesearchaeota archaeon]|nr:hypothetical protein [Candidatus Woesearchaeota archaeon]